MKLIMENWREYLQEQSKPAWWLPVSSGGATPEEILDNKEYFDSTLKLLNRPHKDPRASRKMQLILKVRNIMLKKMNLDQGDMPLGKDVTKEQLTSALTKAISNKKREKNITPNPLANALKTSDAFKNIDIPSKKKEKFTYEMAAKQQSRAKQVLKIIAPEKFKEAKEIKLEYNPDSPFDSMSINGIPIASKKAIEYILNGKPLKQ